MSAANHYFIHRTACGRVLKARVCADADHTLVEAPPGTPEDELSDFIDRIIDAKRLQTADLNAENQPEGQP